MDIIEILKQIFSATDEQTAAFSSAMKEHNIFTTMHENMDVRYPKMKSERDAAVQERDASKATVAELQKAAKGQAELQEIIDKGAEAYKQLEAKLQQERVDAAIKVGLLSEKAVDVDYLTFKLNEKLKGDGETLTLDENGNIKGWKDKLEALKTQFPNQFESAEEGGADGFKVVDPLKLRKDNGGADAPTADSFRGMSYEQRLALKQQNEAQYNNLRKQAHNG